MSSTSVPATAADYFGAMVASYDSLIRRAVPRYDEMTERLVDYLPATADRVLELGCGTGNLSLRLAERYPNAAITFVDGAPEMIGIARARLAAKHSGVLNRTKFLATRFEVLRLPHESFDLVTSCISLHHVLDKKSLYRTLFAMMTPDGRLCFADQLRGAISAIHERNWQRWLDFCRLPNHCTEGEVQSLLDPAAAHDHYTPLQEHLRLLEDAGFVALDCVWRNLIWGIVFAARGADRNL